MAEPADLVVTNARVLTMDGAAPRAEAVAVRDGRVLAVGGRAEVEALAGPATRVVDAKGCSVLPGFVESHMHLFMGGASLGKLAVAMLGWHLLIGLGEALITTLAVSSVLTARPDLVYGARRYASADELQIRREEVTA